MGQGHCHDNHGSGHGQHGSGCCGGEGHHHERFAAGHGRHEADADFGFVPSHRFANREQMLKQLVDYQKDLEQRVADVTDLIRHLTDTGQESSATV
ncbi:MAG: hypothetical protein ACLQUT_04035 [Thermoleophilia bacterium]|jgi:hypothetical protein